MDLLPSKYEKTLASVFEPTQNEDILPVWDVAEGKWKSFRISNVTSFRTPDELTEQDKSGQDIDSNQKQQIEKRKQVAKEKAKQRKEKVLEQIEESKRQSKQRVDKARSIIDRLRNEAIERKNNG